MKELWKKTKKHWKTFCSWITFEKKWGKWEMMFEYDPTVWAILELDYNGRGGSFGKREGKYLKDIDKALYISLFRTRFRIMYWVDRSLTDYDEKKKAEKSVEAEKSKAV